MTCQGWDTSAFICTEYTVSALNYTCSSLRDSTPGQPMQTLLAAIALGAGFVSVLYAAFSQIGLPRPLKNSPERTGLVSTLIGATVWLALLFLLTLPASKPFAEG